MDKEALKNEIVKYKAAFDKVDIYICADCKAEYSIGVEDIIEKVGEQYDATYGLSGKVASWGRLSGDANQFATPLSGTDLRTIGVLKE